MPDGIHPNDVTVYYYHAEGEDASWYPAENVEGWLVADSYEVITQNSTTYLGFLVQHAALVQLGVPLTEQ
jgi:hypothetical protein